MDDSFQSLLCSVTNQPTWFNASLTLVIKLPTVWPSGNKNQSFPPSQPRWVLSWRLSSFNLSWAALSAVSAFTLTRNVCLHLNLWGFPVWSSLTRAWQSFAVLPDLPTFPNGGEGWFTEAFIVTTYTPPRTSFSPCFLAFVVVVTWLLEPVFLLCTCGLGLRLVLLDPEGCCLSPFSVLWRLLCSFGLVLSFGFPASSGKRYQGKAKKLENIATYC